MKRKVAFYDVAKRDNCFFNVAGENHYKANIRRIVKAGRKHMIKVKKWKKLGVVFWLIPEPKNKHDQNALAVCGTRTGKLKGGYIPAKTAKRWVGKVQEPLAVRGIVVGKRRKWGIKLDEGDLRKVGLR